jgi:type I restriction enzyme S subunit
LRFKEFSDEWIEHKLGDLCSTFKSGSGITSEQINDYGDYPVYGGNGLRGFTKTYTHDGFYLLIGRQGALCGNINRSYGKAFISEHAIAVSGNIFSDTNWLAYKLDYLKLNRFSESSAQPGLSVNKLVKLEIAAPSKSEQTKIADFLTAVDEKISQLTQKHDLLTQYKKGVMQQIFSQELRFKDDDGRDFPEWTHNSLGNYSETIQSGKSKSRKDIGKYILYGSTGAIGFSDEFEYQGKNILIARVGANAGYIYEVNGSYGVSDNTLILALKKPNNHSFFFNLLTQANLNKLVFGSGQPLITGGLLKSLSVEVPCVDEQTKIANFLTAIDDKITATQSQLQSVKQYKQGLLQQMFV